MFLLSEIHQNCKNEKHVFKNSSLLTEKYYMKEEQLKENVELSGHGNLIHKCYNKRVLQITMMIFKWLIWKSLSEFQEEIHKKEVFFSVILMYFCIVI